CYHKQTKCNGMIDCADGSDEKNCVHDYECDCNKNNKTCPDGALGFYNRHSKCNEVNDCGDWSDEVNCTCGEGYFECGGIGAYNRERYVRKCDGIPECWNREDECVDCSVKSHFCEDDIICHHDLLLNSMKYCDGKEKREGLGKFSWKCKHGFDEINCTNRFYCRSGSLISISRNYLCDGDNNCDDQTDELKSICKHRRFYCVNGTPHSVGVSKVENGIKDCSDGSDECPANSNKSSIFSSPYEMIANPFLRGIIWLMGLVAMLGNSVVFVTAVIEFKNSTSGTAVANHLFILNLSFSDFLMSVYLLSISIKGVMFSGSYCYHDLEWRSSGLCSFLGALVVISTEASALIMTVMTTFRLLTAWNPIGMNHVEWKQLCLPLIVVWIISVFLGTFP
uniref:G-protein coupled receptors family 1 profile domain-containing protein n=1 Tax=Ciona savignyi TaxID=51511 RepID=H2Z787_CIOSA